MPVLSEFQKEVLQRQYLNIRKLYKTGHYTYAEISARYGRTKQWIYMVLSGKGMPLLEEMELEDLTGTRKDKIGSRKINKKK
jgi:hypothetical protein